MINHRFLNTNEASQRLTTEDEYTRQISNFSLQSMGCRSNQDHLRLLSRVATEYSQGDRRQIDASMTFLNQRLQALGLHFDLEIFFIKTSGHESMGKPYTRQNFVVLPDPFLNAMNRGMIPPGFPDLSGLIAHEVFHIISRSVPHLHEELYALHGFQYNPANLPADLPVLTNPDAPNNDYTVKVNSGEARPILAVNGFTPLALMAADKQLFLNGRITHRDRTNYLAVVRPNTDFNNYHPEEISAENFRLLIEDEPFNHRQEFLRILGS